MVEVPCLGSPGAEPAQIADSEGGREVADVVTASIVEDPRRMLSAQVAGSQRGAPDHLQRFAVTGDEHRHRGLTSTDAQFGAGVGRVVEQVAAGGVVSVVARALGTGQNRPHRQQGVYDKHAFRGDDQDVRQGVPAALRVQQERRVGDDATGGDQCEQDHHRGVGVSGQLVPGGLIRSGNSFKVVDRHDFLRSRTPGRAVETHPRHRWKNETGPKFPSVRHWL